MADIQARLASLEAQFNLADRLQEADQALAVLRLRRTAAIGMHIRDKFTEDDLDAQLRLIHEREWYWRENCSALKCHAETNVRQREALTFAAVRARCAVQSGGATPGGTERAGALLRAPHFGRRTD